MACALNQFAEWFTWDHVVLSILGAAGAVTALDFAGFLPKWAAAWFARNRQESTLKALVSLGVRVQWNQDSKTLNVIQRVLKTLGLKKPAYVIQAEEMLEDDSFGGEFLVGSTRHFKSNGFVDVMGATTDSERTQQYARILKTHHSIQNIPSFDIVATPKDGSPLLGYEFSKLFGAPFILGCTQKVTADQALSLGAHLSLDFPKSLEIKGRRVLLVDDSTTGGSKMASLAESLRTAGAIVEQALILFEPKGKNARDRLANLEITLFAVASGPSGEF